MLPWKPGRGLDIGVADAAPQICTCLGWQARIEKKEAEEFREFVAPCSPIRPCLRRHTYETPASLICESSILDAKRLPGITIGYGGMG